MNVLELYAGSRSVAKAAKVVGGGRLQVFSSDINDFESIDYVVDILEFDPSRVPWLPDVIWASPPCTGFSVASMQTHWKGSSKGIYIPATDTAKLGIALVKKTLEIIRHFQKLNPDLVFFMENPRGLLRKMTFLRTMNMTRHTVSYCQYGDTRMKPTDIWTNSETWQPRPICKNGDPCHERAPRSSKTGTQGMKNAYERSKIPEALCQEILLSCLKKEKANAE